MPFSVAVAMAMVKPEGLAPPKKYFFKTVIILNYHVKFQVDITIIKEKVSAHRCLALTENLKKNILGDLTCTCQCDLMLI